MNEEGILGKVEMGTDENLSWMNLIRHRIRRCVTAGGNLGGSRLLPCKNYLSTL